MAKRFNKSCSLKVPFCINSKNNILFELYNTDLLIDNPINKKIINQEILNKHCEGDYDENILTTNYSIINLNVSDFLIIKKRYPKYYKILYPCLVYINSIFHPLDYDILEEWFSMEDHEFNEIQKDEINIIFNKNSKYQKFINELNKNEITENDLIISREMSKKMNNYYLSLFTKFLYEAYSFNIKNLSNYFYDEEDLCISNYFFFCWAENDVLCESLTSYTYETYNSGIHLSEFPITRLKNYNEQFMGICNFINALLILRKVINGLL
jgi:hypothetical protein